jgi:alkylated DNA repair dioxygenase AlkB
MAGRQRSLFEDGEDRSLPAGFRYAEEAITPSEESSLLSEFVGLPFKEFQFHVYEGRRRVVSFGWRYDFSREQVLPADPIPAFLHETLQSALTRTGYCFERLQQVLITEYAPGAPIGWHRDKPQFEQVLGLSLLSECRFRMRRSSTDKWQRASLLLVPCSAYLLEGPARWEWEHSIPPVTTKRYSITFRNLRSG